MKLVLSMLAALAALAGNAADAATMKAEFMANVTSFYDGANRFGGQTAEVGDTITLTYLYDPDLAGPDWRNETETQAYVFGGDYYTGYGVPVKSPISVASIKIGSATYAFDAKQVGNILLGGFEDARTYLTRLNFSARSNDDEVLLIYYSLTTETPSLLLNPSLTASYDFNTPLSNFGNSVSIGAFYHTFVDEYGDFKFDTRVDFNITRARISPYTVDPSTPDPSPVPLPAGAPLLLAGLAALGVVRRKRNAPLS